MFALVEVLIIVDKKNKDESITNLLNRHDTGSWFSRHITEQEKNHMNQERTMERWPYNPVQGGDMYGNESKIVDFKIEEDRIYIKWARDWAKQANTICYMENEYSIEKNIKVSTVC